MQSSAARRFRMASRPIILPEPFQGTASWDDWIEHFERVAVITNAVKLKWLKIRLTGKAAAALKCCSDETLGDYSALKEALKKRFEPASKKELYMAEFQARQKTKAEDWASFADDLCQLAEKAYLGLQMEAQEALALSRFLTQIDNPQIHFAVRQKQPANVDQAVQYTLEAESYMNPHKLKVDNTVHVTPVSHILTDDDSQPLEQLVAALPSKESPMSVIMKRLDEIEGQLNSLNTSKRKWEQNQVTRRVPGQSTQSQGQVKAVICFKCG